MRLIGIENTKDAFGLSDEQFKNLKGSPYINEEFVSGNIYNGKELTASNVYLRYNAFSDEIEIKKSKHSSDQEYGALIKEPEVFVKIDEQLYVFLPYQNSNEKGHYFEILSEEKAFDLYKKTEVDYTSPRQAKTSYDKDKPAEFKQTNSYYLVAKNGTFYQLPNSKNKMVKLLSKENKKVKEYAYKNKLDLDKEKDIIRLVSYYNSVVE